MELPLETWKELFRYLNDSDRANFIYCLLGEERPLKLPVAWQDLLEFLNSEIKSEDSFVNQRKALRTAYTTYLKDKLGANIDNYMNDDHLFCFQCHDLLSISHVSLNENRAVVSRVKWDPEGLKIKSKKNFDYDNTISEMRELIDKLLPPESDLGIVEGVKTVILTKECLKCHISAHFERPSYCDNCHKENMAVLMCGCGRGYCLLCTLPVLTEQHRLNGLCYRCNRLICDNCAECCHFVDINCYKRFCHRCAEDCEFCGMETSCNEHADNRHYRLNLCLAPEPKNKFLYYSLISTPTNDVQ